MFDVVMVLNVSLVFGRVVGGWLGDWVGVYNVNVVFLVVVFIVCFVVWLFVEEGKVGMIGFVVLFGFMFGSNVSLMLVMVGKLCGMREYGRYYGMVYIIVSFGVLVVIFIVGKLVLGSKGSWDGLIVLMGVVYFVLVVVFVVVKMLIVGWRLKFWVIF